MIVIVIVMMGIVSCRSVECTSCCRRGRVYLQGDDDDDDDDDDDGQSFVVCVLHSCLSREGESGRRKEGRKKGSERESLDANKKEGGTRNEEDLPLLLVIDDG